MPPALLRGMATCAVLLVDSAMLLLKYCCFRCCSCAAFALKRGRSFPNAPHGCRVFAWRGRHSCNGPHQLWIVIIFEVLTHGDLYVCISNEGYDDYVICKVWNLSHRNVS